MRVLRAAAGAGAALILTLPVVVVGAPLWVVTVLTHWLARRIEPRAETWDRLIEFEPEIGWKPRGGLRTRGVVDDVFRVSTDADGWRGGSSLEDSEIVVFGDSFAWGQGIDDADFFADRARGVRVKAIGANGYNMVQELLWMRRVAPSLTGRRVVWFVFLGNDLYDNLQPNLYHYRQPFVRESKQCDGWEIVHQHVSRQPWTATGKWPYYETLAELCRQSYLSTRVYGACGYLIEEAARLCAAAGARLTVMTIPDRSQLHGRSTAWLSIRAPEMIAVDHGYPDTRISEICALHGVEFVPLRAHLTGGHYKEHDLHWNRAGHFKVAQVLSELDRPYAGSAAPNSMARQVGPTPPIRLRRTPAAAGEARKVD